MSVTVLFNGINSPLFLSFLERSFLVQIRCHVCWDSDSGMLDPEITILIDVTLVCDIPKIPFGLSTPVDYDLVVHWCTDLKRSTRNKTDLAVQYFPSFFGSSLGNGLP